VYVCVCVCVCVVCVLFARTNVRVHVACDVVQLASQVIVDYVTV
jgi:hypothetical protein